MLARIKTLFRHLAVYGLGDVATSLISLLLLPVYTQYLTPSDYGVIAMLLTVEASGKILFRWGVDTAFMRLYYDCTDQKARQRLSSTLFFFGLVFALLMLLHFSVRVSSMERRITMLVQELGLLTVTEPPKETERDEEPLPVGER